MAFFVKHTKGIHKMIIKTLKINNTSCTISEITPSQIIKVIGIITPLIENLKIVELDLKMLLSYLMENQGLLTDATKDFVKFEDETMHIEDLGFSDLNKIIEVAKEVNACFLEQWIPKVQNAMFGILADQVVEKPITKK